VSREHAPPGFNTLIRPRQDALTRHDAQLWAITAQNKAARQANLRGWLNLGIAGWNHDDSAVVRKAIFQRLDHQLEAKLARGARDRHPRQSRPWIVPRDWRTDQLLRSMWPTTTIVTRRAVSSTS
jgi:hypothetical protein